MHDEHAAPIKYTYVEGPFGPLHVRYARPDVDGGLTPVLCLHPNPMSGRLYEPLLKQLGRDRLAIAVDTPGCGQSAPPPSPPTVQEYAAAVADAALHFSLSKVNIIGAETGARLAVALAERFRPRVLRLALIQTPVWTAEEKARIKTTYAPAAITAAGDHLVPDWKRFAEYLPAEADLSLPSDLYCDMTLGLGRPSRTWPVLANSGFAYEDHMPNVTQPVLVLNPKGALHEHTNRMSPLLRRGKVVDVAYTLPTALIYHATELAAQIRDFFDGPLSELSTEKVSEPS